MDGIGYVNKELYLREFQASFLKRWKFSIFACLLTWLAVSLILLYFKTEDAKLLVNVSVIVGGVIGTYIFLDGISTYQLKSGMYRKHFNEEINFNNMTNPGRKLILTYFKEGYDVRRSVVFYHVAIIFIVSIVVCFYNM